MLKLRRSDTTLCVATLRQLSHFMFFMFYACTHCDSKSFSSFDRRPEHVLTTDRRPIGPCHRNRARSGHVAPGRPRPRPTALGVSRDRAILHLFVGCGGNMTTSGQVKLDEAAGAKKMLNKISGVDVYIYLNYF